MRKSTWVQSDPSAAGLSTDEREHSRLSETNPIKWTALLDKLGREPPESNDNIDHIHSQDRVDSAEALPA